MFNVQIVVSSAEFGVANLVFQTSFLRGDWMAEADRSKEPGASRRKVPKHRGASNPYEGGNASLGCLTT